MIDVYDMISNDEYKALDTNRKQKLREIIKKDNEEISLICSVVDEIVFPRISVAKC